MTPIGEICKRLDELGIEHDDSIIGAVSWGNAEYEQYCDGLTRLIVLHATPAQAIAATVGAGTCEDNGFIGDDVWYFTCSKCGCEFEYMDFACEFAEGRGLGRPNFCPNCGCKVK